MGRDIRVKLELASTPFISNLLNMGTRIKNETIIKNRPKKPMTLTASTLDRKVRCDLLVLVFSTGELLCGVHTWCTPEGTATATCLFYLSHHSQNPMSDIVMKCSLGNFETPLCKEIDRLCVEFQHM